MKAVGYRAHLPVADAQSLLDLDLPVPEPGPRDLRVAVRAVSVNPVDTKLRLGALRLGGPSADGQAHVLGFDAAGVVEAVGAEASLFRPGDEVFYAGSIARPGTNAALHLVDERIVGRKPRTLDFAGAAALPLTSITAWELLFDRLGVAPPPELDGYADVLVAYWAEHLDPLRARRRREGTPLTGRTVVVTGASSGIGREVALAVARRGGTPLLLALRSAPVDEGRFNVFYLPEDAALPTLAAPVRLAAAGVTGDAGDRLYGVV